MNDFYNLKLSINKQLSSQRLDKVLVTSLNSYSRTQIKNLIKTVILLQVEQKMK